MNRRIFSAKRLVGVVLASAPLVLAAGSPVLAQNRGAGAHPGGATAMNPFQRNPGNNPANLGSNPLTYNLASFQPPGRPNNYLTNPLMGNPAGNLAFSNNIGGMGYGGYPAFNFANEYVGPGYGYTNVGGYGGYGGYSSGFLSPGANFMNPYPFSYNMPFGFGNGSYGNPTGLTGGYYSTPFGTTPGYYNSPVPGNALAGALNYQGLLGGVSPFGYGNGYGFGGYGGLGGYGFGGFGGYGGYLGGISPYNEVAAITENYALANSRYNLNTAEAVQAYAAANFYNTMARTTAANNYPMTAPAQSKFPIRWTTNNAQPNRAARHNYLPIAKVVDDKGQIQWPSGAPTSPGDVAAARSDADKAVQDVASAYKKDGRAPVSEVVDAENKVEAYGRKAIETLGADRQADAQGLGLFLGSLEHALNVMGNGVQSIGGAHIKPDNAPKTAGEVLKSSVIDEKAKPKESDNPAPQPGARTAPARSSRTR